MALTGGTLSTRMIELVGDLDVDATIKNINRSITEIERRLKQTDKKVQLNVELFGRIEDIRKDITALQKKLDASSSIGNIKLGVELKDTTVKEINEQVRALQAKVDGAKTMNKLELDVEFDFTGAASKIKEEMKEISAFMQQYGDRMKSVDIINLDDDAQNVERNANSMKTSFGEVTKNVNEMSNRIESQLRDMTGSTGKFAVSFKQDFTGAIEGASATLTEADGTVRKFNMALNDSQTHLVEASRSTKVVGDQHERIEKLIRDTDNAQRQLNQALQSAPKGLSQELVESAQGHIDNARATARHGEDLNKASTSLEKFKGSLSELNVESKQLVIEQKFDEAKTATREAVAEFERLGGSKDRIEEFRSSIENMSDKSVTGMKTLKTEVENATREIIDSSSRIDQSLSEISRIDFARAVDQRDIQTIKNYIEEMYGASVETIRLTEANDKLGRSVDRVKVDMQAQGGAVKSYTVDVEKGMSNADRAVRQVSESTKTLNQDTGVLGGTFGQIISRVTQYVGAIELLQAGMRAVRETITEILEINAQMTELARVADPSLNLDVILSKSVDLAKELGSSVEEVVGSVAEMARTFGEYNEAQLIAITSTATIMGNVSDLSLAQSTETLVGAMQAFNIAAEDSIGIVDSLNEVNTISLPAQKCA